MVWGQDAESALSAERDSFDKTTQGELLWAAQIRQSLAAPKRAGMVFVALDRRQGRRPAKRTRVLPQAPCAANAHRHRDSGIRTMNS